MPTQLTPAQLATLTTEIQTDPNGYGYAADIAVGYDGGVAIRLNQVRAGITVRQPAIRTFDLLEAIDNRDFVTGTPSVESGFFQAWFESITQGTAIALQDDDGTDNRVLGNLRRMLQNPGPQGSRARVGALATRTGSRFEQLFGSGRQATVDDVAAALGRG